MKIFSFTLPSFSRQQAPQIGSVIYFLGSPLDVSLPFRRFLFWWNFSPDKVKMEDIDFLSMLSGWLAIVMRIFYYLFNTSSFHQPPTPSLRLFYKTFTLPLTFRFYLVLSVTTCSFFFLFMNFYNFT